MYINDTHIGFFIGAAILGLFVGQLIEWISKRNYKKYRKIYNKYKII